MASERVRVIFEADQEDRSRFPIDAKAVWLRDVERRAEVRRHLTAAGPLDGWDCYRAAVVLIHGDETADIEDAFALARRAIELDPEPLEIRSFYALAQDRLLLSRGEPQWYGTQKVLIGERLALAPIEPEGVSDEERVAKGVFTLEQRYREIEVINRARAEIRRRAEAAQASEPSAILRA